jgi:lactoylglutathione lyase
VVFEIYPCGAAPPSPAAVRLGFRVASLEDALAAIGEQGGPVVAAPEDTPWGHRAVVADPDGR